MQMTALSAGVGLFPATIHGIGSRVQRPSATVVIDSMSIDPLLLLLLLWVVASALRRIFLSHDTSLASASEPATGGGAVATEGGD
jgi:Cu/Ag efflux pump CusA